MQRFKKRLVALWVRYERIVNLGSLIGGFIFDLFLAKRPDSVYDNLLLIFYLCTSAAIIVALNRRVARQGATRPLLFIFILQFCFGGLASNLLILYGKSGTLGTSLLFVGLLAAFALGNEFLKTRYDQLRFNVAIYYFLLLTYCIIAVPTFILHAIGTLVFLASGAASLAIVAVLLWALRLLVFKKRETNKIYEVSIIVFVIFFVFSGLYFLQVIPPVPLSLKNIGIYHTLVPLGAPDAAGNIYSATYEEPAWWAFWRDTSSTYTYRPGESAFCFSSVFAPGNLTTPIVHRWEEYNTQSNDWETQSLATFPISGGRAGGYRGWSIETNLSPGAWRCDVETGQGALIGRITFTVAPGTPTLSTTAL